MMVSVMTKLSVDLSRNSHHNTAEPAERAERMTAAPASRQQETAVAAASFPN
jgi:hypothetical protein